MTYERCGTLTGTALSWGCVPELDLIGLAEAAARHGFPEIAVQPGQFFRARADPDWRRKLEATGVRIGVVDALMGYLPGAPDPARVPAPLRESYSRSAEECLEAAVELGARTLNVAHFLGRTDVAVDDMATAADELGAPARKSNVRIGLEFIPGTGLPDLDTALRVVESVDSPSVGILFDTWHHIRSGGTPDEVTAAAAARVIEVQISGWRPPPATETYVPMTGRLVPGEGTAAVGEMVRRLRATSPDLVLSVEVFTAERGNPDARVARLAAATRAFLADLDIAPTKVVNGQFGNPGA
ncbi:sugar phosphate isomerase/epimerase [Rhodococcus hoagii]|nr:sugar phosphate isomerase/epimerase [Prescottella equi]